MLRYYPAINRSLIATHGVLLGPDALSKLRQAIGMVCYVYSKIKQEGPHSPKGRVNTNLVLCFVFESISNAGVLLGFERNGIRTVLIRGGVFRSALLFSTTLLSGVQEELIAIPFLQPPKEVEERGRGIATISYRAQDNPSKACAIHSY